MSGGFISLHAKPHKTHVLWTWILFMKPEALLELLNPRKDKESVMFGFAGSFMMILSCM